MDALSTFLFAGGGTGGHLFPGIAIAAELRNRDACTGIVFVGSSREIEATIIAEHGLAHRILPVEPLPTLKRNPLRFAVRNWQAWREATRLLKEIRPTAVIGLGGYASAPIIWAANRHGIPIILLEQNVIPGRTTRWLSRYASQVCVSFEESRQWLPRARSVHVTGNPIRVEIAALYDSTPQEVHTFPTSSAKPELLILGGSQGADSLNDAVMAAIRQMRDSLTGWQFIHQSGPRQVEVVRKTYEELGLSAVVQPFFHDMPARYASASLVISRAGATTLAELACAGIAMILLPYPHAADDHQQANAQVLVHNSAAVVVRHADAIEATASALSIAMRPIVDSSALRKSMGTAARQLAHPHATQAITDVITGAAFASAGRARLPPSR